MFKRTCKTLIKLSSPANLLDTSNSFRDSHDQWICVSVPRLLSVDVLVLWKLCRNLVVLIVNQAIVGSFPWRAGKRPGVQARQHL